MQPCAAIAARFRGPRRTDTLQSARRRGSGSRSSRIAAGGKSGLRRAGWPLTAAPSDRGKVPQKGDGPGAARRRGVGEKEAASLGGAGDGAVRQTPPGARQTSEDAWPALILRYVARAGGQPPAQRNDCRPASTGAQNPAYRPSPATSDRAKPLAARGLRARFSTLGLRFDGSERAWWGRNCIFLLDPWVTSGDIWRRVGIDWGLMWWELARWVRQADGPDVFRGTFEQRIDDKGRVNVPQRFRDIFGPRRRSALRHQLARGRCRCLDAYLPRGVGQVRGTHRGAQGSRLADRREFYRQLLPARRARVPDRRARAECSCRRRCASTRASNGGRLHRRRAASSASGTEATVARCTGRASRSLIEQPPGS